MPVFLQDGLIKMQKRNLSTILLRFFMYMDFLTKKRKNSFVKSQKLFQIIQEVNVANRYSLKESLPMLIIICFGIVVALALFYFSYKIERMENPIHPVPNPYFGISISSEFSKLQ